MKTFLNILLLSLLLRAAPAYATALKEPDLKELAARITAGASDEAAKVRAIYSWITDNIRYDMKRFQEPNHRERARTVTEILKEKKALPEEYSLLFRELCRESGIETVRVKGYVKDQGYLHGVPLYAPNHEWNLVRIDGSWNIIDLAWACGQISYAPTFGESIRNFFSGGPDSRSRMVFVKSRNDTWYLLSPERFSITHLPSDPRFQLQSPAISANIFVQSSTVIAAELHGPDYRKVQPFIFTGEKQKEQLMAEAEAVLLFNPRNQAERLRLTGDACMLWVMSEKNKSRPDTLLLDSILGFSKQILEIKQKAAELNAEEHTRRRDSCAAFRNRQRDQHMKNVSVIVSMQLWLESHRENHTDIKKKELSSSREINKVIAYYEELRFPQHRQKIKSDAATLNALIGHNKKLIRSEIDSIQQLMDQLKNIYGELDTLWFDTVSSWNQSFEHYSRENLKTTKNIVVIKKQFWLEKEVDLRWPLRDRALLLDTLRYLRWIKSGAQLEQKLIEYDIEESLKNIIRFTKSIRKKLIENIKLGQDPKDLASYYEALGLYEKALRGYSRKFRRFSDFADAEVRWCRKNEKICAQALEELKTEAFYDAQRHNMKQRFIKLHYLHNRKYIERSVSYSDIELQARKAREKARR
jgi:hypothetical protein